MFPLQYSSREESYVPLLEHVLRYWGALAEVAALGACAVAYVLTLPLTPLLLRLMYTLRRC